MSLARLEAPPGDAIVPGRFYDTPEWALAVMTSFE